ncbi:hypothetical protein SAMN05216567_13214 [Variovorax sp. OK605]|uniref:hypothetical protein n=1 Tax=Variovorax sp. OK605 TaxID=1855317 RepID=UPI0008E4CCFC|nr:hypothetical protein [Variovorax sp. OK605]SFQ73521.1 hypothetical protein SAMN05216567_13214 [Variovorax sp. OK605]
MRSPDSKSDTASTAGLAPRQPISQVSTSPLDTTVASTATANPSQPTPGNESRATPIPDQLHVNLWEVRNPSVLDLGIMIRDWQSVAAVIVDLPWDVQREHIEDLGSRLNSEKTVAAIFNEIVQYNGSADQYFANITFRPIDIAHTVETAGAKPQGFILLRLPGRSYQVDRIALGQGVFSSQLRIDLPAPGTLVPDLPDPLYLRFRIDKVPQSVYSSSFALADRNLLSSSTTTRVIDFRINVRRGIPDEILAGHHSFRFPKFKKIHFFLTIDRTQICDFESQNFVGCRSLVDEKIWNDYLQTKPSERKAEAMKQYLGYQWTAALKPGESSSIGQAVKDLVVLGRFSSNDSNIAKSIRFVILGLVFGMMGNGFWDALKPVDSGYLAHLREQSFTLFLLIALLAAAILVILPWSWGNVRRYFGNNKH